MDLYEVLSPDELSGIYQLVPDSSIESLSLQRLWCLMDRVWDEMGCDNNSVDPEKLKKYYQHPIWLLNGLFAECHDLSLQHRHAISDWVAKKQPERVLDFGGGFGTLARMIVDRHPEAVVDIYEPFPSQAAQKLCRNYSSINFVSSLSAEYDCLVSTDVLEHVEDPLNLLSCMISAVKTGGYLVIANHFYPSIKCHLPVTFHLRYSFDEFASRMGLEVLGPCTGSHATLYRKKEAELINWSYIRYLEWQSKTLFPWRELDRRHLLPWRKRFRNLFTEPGEMMQRAKRKFRKLR